MAAISAEPSPPAWHPFFDSCRTVPCASREITFNVYSAGDSGPVALLLHGGGYSGLTWALLAANLKSCCRVFAPDLRGHGLTVSTNDADLSAATLAADVAALWAQLFAAESQPPPTLLVGHSMGGAIAVHAASLMLPAGDNTHHDSQEESAGSGGNAKLQPAIPTLEGIVVIDVVEGTALASLQYMQSVLQRRPASFESPQAAVAWAVSTGFSRCREAAEVSVPAMLTLRLNEDRKNIGDVNGSSSRQPAGPATAQQPLGRISEGAAPTPPASLPPRPPMRRPEQLPAQSSAFRDESEEDNISGGGGTEGSWVWRTDLAKSAVHWEGWYRGLSTTFLSLRVPKVLILAGTDRLDRELTIGQMQGKFQLVLLPRAGHSIHEDDAEAVEVAVAGFVRRFRIGQADKCAPGVPTGVGNTSLFRTR